MRLFKLCGLLLIIQALILSGCGIDQTIYEDRVYTRKEVRTGDAYNPRDGGDSRSDTPGQGPVKETAWIKEPQSVRMPSSGEGLQSRDIAISEYPAPSRIATGAAPATDNAPRTDETGDQTVPVKEMIPDSVLYQRIQQYQREIYVNNDRTHPTDEGFTVLSGSRILISAPHATSQMREGAVKVADYCTGAIARALHDVTGATVIFTSFRSARDPNYYDDAPYKAALRGLGEMDLAIDLHGTKEESFDIDVGTMHHQSLLGDDRILRLFEELAAKEGLRLSHDFFAAEVQATVTKFSARELRVPAMQLEIARKFRCQDQGQTMRLVRFLSGFIERIAAR